MSYKIVHGDRSIMDLTKEEAIEFIITRYFEMKKSEIFDVKFAYAFGSVSVRYLFHETDKGIIYWFSQGDIYEDTNKDRVSPTDSLNFLIKHGYMKIIEEEEE